MKMNSRVIYFLVEVLCLVVALMFGWFVSARVNIIPIFVLGAKNAVISPSDIFVILGFYVVVAAPVFISCQFVTKGVLFLDVKRTIDEIYVVVFTASVASIGYFILTTVNFSLNFVVWSSLIWISIIMGLFFVVRWKRRPKNTSSFIWIKETRFFYFLFGSVFSWRALAVIIIATLPICLAFAYKKDAGVRDTINLTRLYFNRPAETGWVLESVFRELDLGQPIDLEFSPADPSEIYVLERSGGLYRVSDQPSAVAELVLDLRSQVGEVSSENGALGFALDPNFNGGASESGDFVYVYYTHVRPGSQHNRLSRFDLKLPTPEQRLASEFILIEQQRGTSGTHSGGSDEFGPDSFLYMALGDAADLQNPQAVDRSILWDHKNRRPFEGRQRQSSHREATRERPDTGLLHSKRQSFFGCPGCVGGVLGHRPSQPFSHVV